LLDELIKADEEALFQTMVEISDSTSLLTNVDTFSAARTQQKLQRQDELNGINSEPAELVPSEPF
jgi:hypothetical protein